MLFFLELTTPNRGGGAVQRDGQEYQLKSVLREGEGYYILETPTYNEMRMTTMHLVDDQDGVYESAHGWHFTKPRSMTIEYYGSCHRN